MVIRGSLKPAFSFGLVPKAVFFLGNRRSTVENKETYSSKNPQRTKVDMIEPWVEIPKIPACVSLRFSELASKRFFH